MVETKEANESTEPSSTSKKCYVCWGKCVMNNLFENGENISEDSKTLVKEEVSLITGKSNKCTQTCNHENEIDNDMSIDDATDIDSIITKKENSVPPEKNQNTTPDNLTSNFLEQSMVEDSDDEKPLIFRTREKCWKCSKIFTSQSSLEKHLMECQKKAETKGKKFGKFQCEVCLKEFKYQKSFLTHLKSHANDSNENDEKACYIETEPDLPEPDRATTSPEKSDSSDNEFFLTKSEQCKICGKVFATKRNLKRHLVTHSGLKYTCKVCEKNFSRPDKLKEHEQSKHRDDFYGENYSDEGLDGETKRNSDGKRKEKGLRPHKCELCPKAFAQEQSLANHVERHNRAKDNQKRFLCEICSKCFAQSGSLAAHLRVHTGVRPYVCNICSRAFTKSTYLQLHVRSIHSKEKPYICQYCSRPFARANTLARHITGHTGEAKYHCKICTKSFRRLTSLNEHSYTHTGERPYACKICSKRYNNAGSLWAHTKKCKAQSLLQPDSLAEMQVENDQQNNESLNYSPKKVTSEMSMGQPYPQFLMTQVEKPEPSNVQNYAPEDQNAYAVDSKQSNKAAYYTLYPTM